MADFKTHIAVSTAVGVAYGYVGWDRYGFPLESCVLAGGLCSVSGMLPDLDSDSGVPIREATSLAAAVVPMLLVDRLRELQLTPEGMVLAAGAVYLGIRFIIAELFRRYTVHRGMWHSIPACISVGLLSYLLMHCQDDRARIYKCLAVSAGFLVHLILDEIWAVAFKQGRFQLKSSFGSALKFWGPSVMGNLSAYAKLGLLAWLVWVDNEALNKLEQRIPDLRFNPNQWNFPTTAEFFQSPSLPSPTTNNTGWH